MDYLSNDAVKERLWALDGLAEATRKSYAASLQRIARLIQGNVHEWLDQRPLELIEVCRRADCSVNTKKHDGQLLCKLCSGLRLLGDGHPNEALYVRYFQACILLSQDQNDERRATEVVPTWETYRERVDAEWGEHSKQSLVAALYQEAPCRDDFGGLLLVPTLPTHPTENYLVVMGPLCRIVITQHKTMRKRGWLEFPLSKDLSKKLRRYLVMNGFEMGQPLFPEPSLSQFVVRMNTRLGYDTCGGVNLLRHMTVAAARASATPEERLDLATSMGHTVRTQQGYVRPIG